MDVRTVIIIEPDLPIRNLLRVLLARGDYKVVFARDGVAAKRALARATSAILIIDIGPRPSTLERGTRGGVGLLHYIQRNQPDALNRVIVVSALPDREVIPLIPAGVSFLRKPFDIDTLLSAIERAAVSGTDLKKTSASDR